MTWHNDLVVFWVAHLNYLRLTALLSSQLDVFLDHFYFTYLDS